MIKISILDMEEFIKTGKIAERYDQAVSKSMILLNL